MSINVLCLHGCNQTQEMFAQLLKHYIRIGEKQYNLKFYFTEAKYDHPLGGKTWYQQPLNVADIGKIEYSKELVGDTLDDISRIIAEKNITVLLGFSQGANVVDTFLKYQKHDIRRAVLMSGYSLVVTKLFPEESGLLPESTFAKQKGENTPINVTAMNVISDADTVVPSHLCPGGYNVSRQRTLKHDKGHKLPTQAAHIREICEFCALSQL